tara:strand:+ start:106 stop:231 length:126 start_codon:yes stop_codon:yes gene_type:complete
MEINTVGERNFISEESSPLAECGEYSRNLADKIRVTMITAA